MSRFAKTIAPVLVALAAGTIYGYFIHRNHVFPYLLLNPPADAKQADIVMLGDSLTTGSDWRAMLPGIDVVNQGVGGDTTLGLLNRIDLVKRERPRMAVLMFGLNDLQFGEAPTAVFGRYERAISALGLPGDCVVVQSTLFTARGVALNAAIGDLDRRLGALCASGKCTFLDLNQTLAPAGELPPSETVDGVHLTAAAYRQWRDMLRPYLSDDRCRR